MILVNDIDMNDYWKRYFIEHSKTPRYKHKLKKTKEFIDKQIEGKKAYLAYSGGKDSTVLLHMIGDRVTVVHWYAGKYYIPDYLHKEIVYIAKTYAKDFIEYTSKKYDELKREAINLKGKYYLGFIVPKILAKKYDIAILGIRAEESCKRKFKNMVKYEKGIKTIYPLLHWSWEDVWAYIVTNNVKYISYYDKCAKIMSYDKIRFCSLFYPGFNRFGQDNIDGLLYWDFKNII